MVIGAMTKKTEPEAIFIRVHIKEDEEGLFFATSPDMSSLFVVDGDFADLMTEIPEVIKALLKAEKDHDFDIWRTRVADPDERAWVAIPMHIASGGMHATQ